MNSSTAPSSITISNDGLSMAYGTCKYCMPCGYCELKKEQCNLWQKIAVHYDDNKLKITPTWNPDQNEVTCNGK